MRNKIIAVIPARYEASRFSGKLMQLLGEKTVITTTYQNVVETGLFDEVFVATDSEFIFNEKGFEVNPKEKMIVGFDKFNEEKDFLNIDDYLGIKYKIQEQNLPKNHINEKLKDKNIILRLTPIIAEALISYMLNTEGGYVYIIYIFMFYLLRDISL